ncbi:MAG TPA: helix-turn-helix transcriptional regulator [Caldimonas sp.]|nr:helix-turn-helix transcriptional regulator [Caldimonas sp.]HEX2540525.1 helix-turn-helix transcriptional regulator [Caldimonas sp.]
MPSTATAPVGALIRDWRLRRRWSQLDLAGEAAVSTRHLSYVETGRAAPSREMVLRLASRLDVPLRERNRLLAAAGYAPMFAERSFDDPALASARAAIERILRAHEPWPALAVDRHWSLVAGNDVVPVLLAGVDPALLQAPVNVLRLSLHPGGLAPRIANLHDWREHLLMRLERQAAGSGDPVLAALLDELRSYPVPGPERAGRHDAEQAVVVPLLLDSALGRLSFISTTLVFGAPNDILLSELALETFLPADEATAVALRSLPRSRG